MVSSDNSEGLSLVCQGSCPINGPVKLHRLRQCLVGCAIVVAMVDSATCRWAPTVGWGLTAARPTPAPTLHPPLTGPGA